MTPIQITDRMEIHYPCEHGVFGRHYTEYGLAASWCDVPLPALVSESDLLSVLTDEAKAASCSTKALMNELRRRGVQAVDLMAPVIGVRIPNEDDDE